MSEEQRSTSHEHSAGQGADSTRIAGVLETMQRRLDEMVEARSSGRFFLGTYRRTTAAVGAALDRFDDPAWVESWDVAFAQLYLDALDSYLAGEKPSRPWRLAFGAPADFPDLRHVLLGINAHINYDLPRALLAVISEADFEDPALMDRRKRDHERIDDVLAARVAAEDEELPQGTLTDRLLTPLNRLGTKRFLQEAREKVWHNTYELHAARLMGPDAYRRRLAELELLSAAKVADLIRPGQVLLRLAVTGFGVTLPPGFE